MIRTTFIMALLLLFAAAIGCSGGIPAGSGNISGPNAIYESTHAYYNINYIGTNPETRWSCNPPGAGQFDDATTTRTKFTAIEVDADTNIELRCLIKTDQWSTVFITKVITIENITGFWVSEIEGPDWIYENSSATFSVYTGGDSGIIYSWLVNPPDAGHFNQPQSSTTGFIAKEVEYDTPVQIKAVIASDNFGPVLKTISLTVKNIIVLNADEIEGPSQIDEMTPVSFSVEASGDTGITYEWSANPQVGEFDTPFSSSTTFTSGNISADIPVEISVKLSSDNYGQLSRTKDAIILNTREGWVRAWGGLASDKGYGVSIDHSDNIYVAGSFEGTADFDPGPGIDEQTSNGLTDAYLSKFDSEGLLQWVRTWGCSRNDRAEEVAVDNEGNAYVFGYYWYEAVDFDPGPGIDMHECNGGIDCYISKFDPDGNFEWARTWGGTSSEFSEGIAVDAANNIFVTGSFGDSVDFDPGPGTDIHTSKSSPDYFLSKFNSGGDFQWTRTWNRGISKLAIDSMGNIFVAGEGTTNIFQKFGNDGNLQWQKTWPGDDDHPTWIDYPKGMGVDNYDNIYISGTTREWKFSDPPILNNISSFVCKFNDNGEFLWRQTWPESENWHLSVSCTGDAYSLGTYLQVCLTKHNSDGVLLWKREWKGDYTSAFGAALDNIGNVYIVGRFGSTIDFDPGPGIFNLTPKHSCEDAFLLKCLPDGYW